MPVLHPTSIPTRRSTPLLVAPAGALVLWALTALPAIALGLSTSRGAFDAVNYHLPTIRTLAERLPRIDVASDDYIVVMTPGYHLAVAAAHRLLGGGVAQMQVVGSLFTAILVATFAALCAAYTGPRRALVLTAPFAVSLYVFSAGVWLLPDNAAWLCVLVILALALRPRVDKWTYFGAGLALCALVCVRQNHIWAAAPIWMAAWLGPTARAPDLEPHPLREIARRIGPGLRAALSTLPAFVLLGFFASVWGGLVPPVFREMYRAGSMGTPEAPLFFLAVFGLLSAPLIAMVGSALVELWAWRRWTLLAAPGVAGALALLVNTKFSVPGGRFSGMWNITHEIDCVLGLDSLSATISPSMVVAIAFGAFMLLLWLTALERRDRWIFASAIAGFAAAQCASYFVWQRYHEPFVLMLLALAASRLPSPERRFLGRGPRTPLLGPSLLTLLLVAMTVQHIATEVPAEPIPRDRLFLTPDRESKAPPGCD